MKQLFFFICVVVAIEPAQLDFLTSGSYTLSPKQWPSWHVVMGSDRNGVLHGRMEKVDKTGNFIFERVGDGLPFFYMKSLKWKSWYVYMTNTDEGRIESVESLPGEEGQWKITSVSGGFFTFSPRKWPHWYMCMKNDYIGTMVGCKYEAGDRGRFTLSRY